MESQIDDEYLDNCHCLDVNYLLVTKAIVVRVL